LGGGRAVTRLPAADRGSQALRPAGHGLFLAWYIGFILLAGYAPDFMARSVYQGLTVGYCIALTQFVMVGTLGLMYLRRAERVYDPLAEKAAQRALATERERLPAGSPADGDTREEGSR